MFRKFISDVMSLISELFRDNLHVTMSQAGSAHSSSKTYLDVL